MFRKPSIYKTYVKDYTLYGYLTKLSQEISRLKINYYSGYISHKYEKQKIDSLKFQFF